MHQGFNWISEQLSEFSERGLTRSLPLIPGPQAVFEVEGRRMINFAGNDYLGIGGFGYRAVSGTPSNETARDFTPGAGASRLTAGNFPVHEQLEEELAALLGAEASLVFSSGYLANIGAITALAGRDDVIVADRLIHASLLDGIMLSRAKLIRFHHNNVDQLRSALVALTANRPSPRRIIVVIEAVYSMDGDLAPLDEIAELCSQFECTLIVDEAHSIGLYGVRGEGRSAPLAVAVPLVRTGSFGKAFGSQGGFVAGPAALRSLLVHSARSFIFNTGLSPSAAAFAREAIPRFAEASLRDRLFSNARLFRESLFPERTTDAASDSAIVPLLVPGNESCVRLRDRLFEEGFLAPAIRAPSVPRGTERLRFSLSATHDPEDVRAAAGVIRALLEEQGER